MESIPYINKKALIRNELLKCAKAKTLRVLTYGEFGKRVEIPARGPWKPILDLIAHEEIDEGLPDITFLIVAKRTGYPGQIGFKPASPPSAAQKDHAIKEIQKVIDLYNPGSANPYAGA